MISADEKDEDDFCFASFYGVFVISVNKDVHHGMAARLVDMMDLAYANAMAICAMPKAFYETHPGLILIKAWMMCLCANAQKLG